MTMGRRDLKTVLLLPKIMNMKLSTSNDPHVDPVDLPLFTIIGWQLTQRNSDCPEEGIRMIAVIRRKPWREVFTTYLPTTLLILTTYVTTFLKSQFLEAALGANLTTMLMMTTIFMTSLSELTDSAYAKFIDVWLIFSQLVPFTEVILLTLKEAYREEEEEEETNEKQKPNIQSLKTTVVHSFDKEEHIDFPQDQSMDKKIPKATNGAEKGRYGNLVFWKFMGKTTNLTCLTCFFYRENFLARCHTGILYCLYLFSYLVLHRRALSSSPHLHKKGPVDHHLKHLPLDAISKVRIF